LDINDDPLKDAFGSSIPHPKAWKRWCFKYGEKNWIENKNFSGIKESVVVFVKLNTASNLIVSCD
jgi:hypothetical protein